MPISAILIPVHLNLKFSLQHLPANFTWVWASHQGSPLAGAIPGSSTTASLPLSAPMCPLSASHVCVQNHRAWGGTTQQLTWHCSSYWKNFFKFLSSFGAGWCQKVVPQHYIPSCVMKISDVLPLTWLEAGLFQKPKQRKFRGFPLILVYAALIHFLETFCQ